MHKRQLMAAVNVLGATVGAAVATGPEWTEMGDAGKLPGSAQVPLGTGSLNKISGNLDGEGFAGFGDFQDVYLVRIVEFEIFLATLAPPTAGGSSDFDTQLWLLTANGLGLLGNDDATSVVEYSEIGPFSTDGSGAAVTSNGLYFIAISGFDTDPVSLAGPIFSQVARTEVSGPDGTGGSMPILDWSPSVGETGSYSIRLRGVEFVDCPADTNGDLEVDFADLLVLLASWGPCAGCPADFDGSGIVDFSDLLLLLASWGRC